MKKHILFAIRVVTTAANALAMCSIASAGVIANWGFETNIPATMMAPTIGPLLPDAGFGVLQGIHQSPLTLWDSLDTAGPDHALGASKWSSVFPQSVDGYLFDIDTRGFSQITIGWLQSSAANGPNVFIPAYSTTPTDPIGFTPLGPYFTTAVDTPFIADLSAVSTVNDKKDLYFELLCGNPAPGRTQIDDVLVSGTLIDPHLIPWFNPAGGIFGNGSNWFNGVAPASADRAAFNMETTYTVSLAANATNAGVVARGGMVTLNLQGRTHTISSGGVSVYGDQTSDTSNFKIMSSAPSGIAQYQAVTIGDNIGSAGYLTVDGSNTTLNATAVVSGVNGTGSMTVSAGADVVANLTSTIGSAVGSTGAVTVTGVGSTWTQPFALMTPTNLVIGASGNGTLSVQSGGLVTLANTNEAIFGDQTGSSGTGTVSGAGSKLSVWALHVGKMGQGQLTINNGGEVSGGTTSIGELSGGTGSVTVTGSGSKLSGGFSVGPLGQGSLTVSAAATVSGGVVVGSNNGTGSLMVTGTGSIVSGGLLQTGSHATVTVADGGTLQSTSIGTVFFRGVTGTSIRIESGGHINVPASNLGIEGASSDLASSPILTVTGAGSTWNSAGQIYLGSNPNLYGRMSIIDGGSVVTGVGSSATNSSGIIALDAAGVGSVTIDGAGSNWTQDGGMSVGFHGNGTLSVTNSGVLSSQDGFIGRFAGSSGNVTIDDHGAWNTSRSFYIGGDATTAGGTAVLHMKGHSFLFVGDTLQVWSGGTIDVDDSFDPGTVLIGTSGFPSVVSPGGIYAADGGNISGNGTLPKAILYSGATISPGPSTATLHIGTVSLASGSVVKIEITSASSFDKLVTDEANLGGDIQISLLDGYVPAIGASFDILDWNTIFGSFATLSLPSLPEGRTWDTSQLYASGLISVASAGVAGDYNGNGTVDAADYTVWRDHLGQSVTLPGDATPGMVTQADYDIWKSNFGNHAGSGSGSSTTVPEPTSFTILFAGLLTLFSRQCGSSIGRLAPHHSPHRRLRTFIHSPRIEC